MKARIAARKVALPSAMPAGSPKNTQKPGPLKTMTGILNLTQFS
jgi:hypothetical protein